MGYPKTGQFVKQWDYLLTSFPPERLFCIGPEPEEIGRRSAFARAEFVGTTDSIHPPLVMLQPQTAVLWFGETSIDDFDHPDGAVYLFGHDHAPLSEDELGEREPDHRVFIPTATKDDLHSWVAAAIVYWDITRG